MHAIWIVSTFSLSVPASSPNISNTTIISSSAVGVSWEPLFLIDWNGIITQYEVEYNQTTFTEIQRTQTMTLNASCLMVNISGLEEYIEYSFRVRAYTNVGPGPYSPPVIAITLEDRKFRICIWCVMIENGNLLFLQSLQPHLLLWRHSSPPYLLSASCGMKWMPLTRMESSHDMKCNILRYWTTSTQQQICLWTLLYYF